MSRRPIIDAGPGLNFLSINQERLLIHVLGELSVPETVEKELLRKSQQEDRFRPAGRVLRKLSPKWIEILSDSPTPELAAVVERVTRLPMEQRLKNSKNLGELMVIAHAVVIAESGEAVRILIDDGDGARIAMSEIRRLERLRAGGRNVADISLVSTQTVLMRAAATKYIPDRETMRRIYQQMRGLDDGLPAIEQTELLSPALWRNASS